MADTPNGETVTPQALENNVTPTATPAAQAPQVNAVDTEVERLKKEAEQAKMNANRLENELRKRTEAEEEAKRKQLEEKEEFRSLYEQEKEKRESFERQLQSDLEKQAIETEQNTIFSEFPTDVQELAKDLGIGLSSNTEEAKAELRSKLEKTSSKVVSGKVTPNNPNTTTQAPNREELLKRVHAGDKQALNEAVKGLEVIQFMKRQNGLE